MSIQNQISTIPNYLPMLISVPFTVYEIFFSPNYFITIPLSLLFLFFSYKICYNYFILFESVIILYVWGRKLEVPYEEILKAEISYVNAWSTNYVIIFHIKNKKKPLGFLLNSNGKKIIKIILSHDIKLTYLRNIKPDQINSLF